MNSTQGFLVFNVDDNRFAIKLNEVIQVVNAVEMIQIPKSPKHVLGTINYHGEFLPVINFRKLFALKSKEIQLADQLIIVQTAKIELAIWADFVEETVSITDDMIAKSDSIYNEAEEIDGLFKMNNGLVLINNVDKFLTEDQIQKLAKSIEKFKEESIQ